MKRFLLSGILALSVITPALADGTDALHNAFVSLAKATSYHIAFETDRGTVDSDFVPPSRMHLMMGPLEMISIDNVTYLKRGDTWTKFSFPGTETLTAQILQTREYAKNQANFNVSDLGPKTLDGEDLHAYQVRPKSDNPTGKPATVYVGRDGYVHRIDATSDRGSAIVRFSKFNAPIKIDAPI